jgi:hypothetical protein
MAKDGSSSSSGKDEFSHFRFFKNMRAAWDLVKEVKIRVIEDNMCLLCSLLIAPYDGFTKPSKIELRKVLI